MAFFKFRFPGQAASSPASAETVAPGSVESIELVRRRARHRLIGAVVLVLIAVVGFPLMFDTQPRPVAMDTPILIPDRPTTAPLKVPKTKTADETSAKPLWPEPKPLAAKEGSAAKEKLVQAVKPKRPAEPSAKAQTDVNKANPSLDGKSTAEVFERHVVQIGAYNDVTKVREVRRELEQAGLSTFIQVLDGKDGKSITRVRVGPFSSREEAEKVAAKVRKLDLSPAVLRI
jgi:DedD protein